MHVIVEAGVNGKCMDGAKTCQFLRWIGQAGSCTLYSQFLREKASNDIVRCPACIAAHAEAKRLDDAAAKLEAIQKRAKELMSTSVGKRDPTEANAWLGRFVYQLSQGNFVEEKAR